MAIALEEVRELTPRPSLQLVPPTTARRRALARAQGRRRRVFVLAVVLLLAALVAASATGLGAADAAGTADSAALATTAADTSGGSVIVGDGDTLWGIAQANLPEGSSVGAYAQALAAHNGVDARTIRPGDVVRLP